MRILTLCLLLLLPLPAAASWQRDVAAAPLLGQGRFCFLGYCLYDAQLWGARDPQRYETPFALVLTYRKNIPRERLAGSGVDEIRRLAARPIPEATLEEWRQQMLRAFVDVKPGDSIAGVFLPGQGARFYYNGRLTAAVGDERFARAFFDIWLHPDTRAGKLRAQLLGGARG